MLRDKIWHNLVNSKFKCFYLGYSIGKYQRRSLSMNIFLSIVSISSVSAWIIWESLPWLWAMIIAASNILIAIKPLLRYDKTVSELNKRLALLENIEIEYERLFFELDSGKLDEDSGSEKYFTLYENQIKSLRTPDELYLSLDKRIKKKAEEDTHRYIYSNYQTKSEKS